MSESGIFNAAVKLTPEQRPAYLDDACRDNPALRREVESLLKAHDATGGILPERTSDHVPLAERPGTMIGPYKLMEQIGEGGFGLVFVAEQQHPVRRRVALKVIKPGMDTRDIVARFEAERQASALMDHPNIAKVLDGGATDSGRPYFVMELVKGIPIIDYCDQQQLTARERLELFVSVCQAVQHAHSKGIIHPDLKPSNILVAPHDGVPVVKVIDFGVAKALGQQLTDKTIYTRFAQMIGTPLYMSPEQAEINALDVDTRSDVYSLGVLLYELLTGTTPFDRQRFQKAAYDEIRRIIKEEEPPKPSTRLSTMGEALSGVSTRRKTEPGKLSAQVKGELDWIVMKALEKDRTRRYETAVGLAKDVQRYLADEPVEACPPSLAYRVRKFVGRHRRAVLVTAAMLGLLCLGLAGTVTGWIHANREAERARHAEEAALHERDIAEKVRKLEEVQRDAARHERDQAQAARDELRRTLYGSNLNLIQVAWDANNTSRVLELLESTRPQQGQEDLRGFEWHFWDRQCHAARRMMKLNFGPPSLRARGEFVAFSGNGERCAAIALGDPEGANSFVIKVWDTADGRELWSFPITETRPMHVGVSGDGRRLALAISSTVKTEGKVTVWDVASRKEVASLTTPVGSSGISPNSPRHLRPMLSHDGRRLAVRAPKGTKVATPAVLVWDVDEKGATPVEHPALDPGLVFSPDGSRLASLALGMTKGLDRVLTYEVRIREAKTGKVLNTIPYLTATGATELTFPTHRDSSLLAYSPDSSMLAVVLIHTDQASGFPSYRGAVFDAQGKLVGTFRPTLRPSYLSLSPDGKRVMAWTGEQDPVGTAWDVTTGEVVQTWKGAVAPAVGAAFSADGGSIYAVTLRGTLLAWDAKPASRRDSRDQGTMAVWSLDASRQCRIRSPSSNISVRDAAGKELLVFMEHRKPVLTVRLNRDGRYAASMDEEGAVIVWDTTTGKVGARVRAPTGGRYRTAPSFSDDGRRVALNVAKSGVKVWEVTPTFRVVFTCEAHSREPILSPDGRRLVTLDEGREATVWDVDTGKHRVLKGAISSLVFSPDGRRVATRASSDGRRTGFETCRGVYVVRVVEVETGKVVTTLEELATGPMAFSPDGTHLATLTPTQGEVVVWEAATGKVRHRLKGHGSAVSGIAFSPDGRRIATASQTVNPRLGTVRLWDARTGSELLALRGSGLTDINHVLSFSPDGHRLSLLGDNGVSGWAQVWDATPREAAKQP